MMKPHSEMTAADESQQVKEDETEVYTPRDADESKIKGLMNYSHLIDDFKESRLPNSSGKITLAYNNKMSAAETAVTVMEEEAEVQRGLEEQIKDLESQLGDKVKAEASAHENYRQKTNEVMCLEMEEPCRWNSTYQQLREYVYKTGDFPPVPSACNNEADRRLSIWVQQQKSLVYSKSESLINAPHRIEALEHLGIEWIESSEEHWDKMYRRLVAYKRQHNSVKLPSFMQCRRSKDKDLAALRHWVDKQEQDVKSGAMAKRRDRLKKLQEVGLPYKMSWEQDWQYYIVQLLKFRSKHGHLSLSGSTDSDLKSFVSEILKRLKKDSTVKLTTNELQDLMSKGLFEDVKHSLTSNGKATAVAPEIVPVDRV